MKKGGKENELDLHGSIQNVQITNGHLRLMQKYKNRQRGEKNELDIHGSCIY
jgi:hypothetical protein